MILPYAGTVYRLGASWDWFTFCWFPESDLALRDTRMLMLHDPHDVPTRACDYFPIIMGKPLRCRLCIPVDKIPAPGLPPFQKNCQHHDRNKLKKYSQNGRISHI